MAWNEIPYVADGQPLSASWLNLLVENVNLLRGAMTIPGAMFEGWKYQGIHQDYYYAVRHKHRWLTGLMDYGHDLVGGGGDVDDFKIYYGNQLVYHDGTPGNDYETFTADLDAITPPLVYGAVYIVKVEYSFKNESGNIQMFYMWETSEVDA